MRSIKAKIRFSFLIFILIGSIGGGASYWLSDKANQLQTDKNSIEQLLLHWANARKNEKEFLLQDRKTISFLETKACPSLEEHMLHIERFYGLLAAIEERPVANDGQIKLKLKKARQLMNSYDKSFHDLVQTYFERGFKDHGLEGEMREFAHDLQKGKSETEKIFALTLRKHEKDFMLRNDQKYVSKLQQTSKKFENYIDNKYGQDSAYQKRILNYIKAYTNHFNKIVALEGKIKGNNNDGLLFQLSSISEKIQPVADELQILIESKVDSFKNFSMLFLLVSIFFLIATGILMMVYYARIISNPIIYLHNGIKDFIRDADSYDDGKLEVKSKDEIGKLTASFKQLTKGIKENLADISSKNKALELKAQEDEKRNWTNHGLAQYADVMKNNFSSQDELTFETLLLLIKYTNSNQGGIFIKNEEKSKGEETMDLKACYAYNRKKYINKTIYKGEGLLGAAWIEKDTIYISEIPDNYIEITSGLGGATPGFLLVVPIMNQEKVEGIIELASFNDFETHQRDFIEQVASRLGTTISTVKNQELTNNLLQESRMATEQLQASEEELRQNMEELQSTQEEMDRATAELQQKIKKLEFRDNLYTTILESGEDGLLVLDADLKISYVNNKFLELSGYSRNGIIGIYANKILKEEWNTFPESADKQILEIKSSSGIILKTLVNISLSQIDRQKHALIFIKHPHSISELATEKI